MTPFDPATNPYPADVAFADGRFTAKGTDRSIGLFEVARAARERNDLPEDLPAQLRQVRSGAARRGPEQGHEIRELLDILAAVVQGRSGVECQDFAVPLRKILVGEFARGDELEVDVSSAGDSLEFRVLTTSTKA